MYNVGKTLNIIIKRVFFVVFRKMTRWIQAGFTFVVFFFALLKCMYLYTNKCTGGKKGGHCSYYY